MDVRVAGSLTDVVCVSKVLLRCRRVELAGIDDCPEAGLDLVG